ncbi:MAG: restriction endonuclease subunit S, partial [Kangiellaceae bacterium]|nr:restriction endonuclease subunit S [Kangiellaceae bacterium]
FKESELGRIPVGWEVVKFRDITKVRQGLQIPISKRKTKPCDNCYPYITIQFVKNNKEIEYIQNPQESVICVEDDVLMTRTENTGIVITNVNGVFHNNFFLIDFDRNTIAKDFLVFYLKSYQIQNQYL